MSLNTLLLFLFPCAYAAVVPTEPSPGDVFEEGSTCSISWNADTSGNWKNMTIDLMSGSNLAMTKVVTVATGLDGTDPSLSPYNCTCPFVTPTSAIYFYQFTSSDSEETPAWTTRFTIATPDGSFEDPSNETQPNGDAVPWGTGTVASASSAQVSSSVKEKGTINVSEAGYTPGGAHSHQAPLSGDPGSNPSSISNSAETQSEDGRSGEDDEPSDGGSSSAKESGNGKSGEGEGVKSADDQSGASTNTADAVTGTAASKSKATTAASLTLIKGANQIPLPTAHSNVPVPSVADAANASIKPDVSCVFLVLSSVLLFLITEL